MPLRPSLCRHFDEEESLATATHFFGIIGSSFPMTFMRSSFGCNGWSFILVFLRCPVWG